MTTGTEPSELERLKQELDNEHQMYLRSLADFDNYRRRVERDRASAAIESKRGIILSLIDLLDSFDRALPHLTDAASSEGVRAIRRQLGPRHITAVGKQIEVIPRRNLLVHVRDRDTMRSRCALRQRNRSEAEQGCAQQN